MGSIVPTEIPANAYSNQASVSLVQKRRKRYYHKTVSLFELVVALRHSQGALFPKGRASVGYVRIGTTLPRHTGEYSMCSTDIGP